MTNKELNRDIRRLTTRAKLFLNETPLPQETEDSLKTELARLIYALDWKAKNCPTPANLRALVALNRWLRAVPFHSFGPGLDQI